MPKVTKQKPTSKKRSTSVVDRIVGLDESDGFLKVNLYGRSGTGKTTLWSSFPKPILAILCSGGNKPGELKSIDTPSNRKSIKKVVLENSEEIKELADYQEDTGKFKTVVLDHASGLQDFVLREVLNLEDIPTQLSWGLATQQQYGQVAQQMKERLRTLLNLDTNVVIVAQEREFNTDTESDLLMPYVGSALTPSVVGWLNPACDYIFNTYIRNKDKTEDKKVGGKTIKKVVGTTREYCLRVGPDATYTTKFRAPKGHKIPDIIVDADYQKIVKLIGG